MGQGGVADVWAPPVPCEGGRAGASSPGPGEGGGEGGGGGRCCPARCSWQRAVAQCDTVVVLAGESFTPVKHSQKLLLDFLLISCWGKGVVGVERGGGKTIRTQHRTTVH